MLISEVLLPSLDTMVSRYLLMPLSLHVDLCIVVTVSVSSSDFPVVCYLTIFFILIKFCF